MYRTFFDVNYINGTKPVATFLLTAGLTFLKVYLSNIYGGPIFSNNILCILA